MGKLRRAAGILLFAAFALAALQNTVNSEGHANLSANSSQNFSDNSSSVTALPPANASQNGSASNFSAGSNGTAALPMLEARRSWKVGRGQRGAGRNSFVFGSHGPEENLAYVLLENPKKYDFGRGDFTLAAWVKTSAWQEGTILARASYQEGKRYELKMNSEGTLLFYMSDASADTGLETAEAINDGSWHHVAAVRKGGTASIYVDGSLRSSAEGPLLDLSGAGTLSVGADMGDYDWSGLARSQFVGEIEGPSAYDLALSSEEIAALRAKG